LALRPEREGVRMTTALFNYICGKVRDDLTRKDLKEKEPALLGYVSDKVMADLRAGYRLDEELINAVLKQPWVETLRGAVTIQDKNLVLDLMKSNNITYKTLGTSLTKSIEQDPKICQELITIFKETNDLDLRFTAMYRILDNPWLQDEFLRSVYELATGKSYEAWKDHVMKWQGGAEHIMERVAEKIHKYPQHKAWVYLYELSWVPNGQREHAKEVISKYKGCQFPTGEAARTILEQMDKVLPAAQ
jgi:hypothetical protein